MRTFFAYVVGILLLMTIGCSPSTNTFTNSANWLPSEFNPKNGILLITKVTWPKKQQTKMEEYMKKNYPYKYEFIDPSDLYVGEYADTATYCFMIVESSSSHQMHQGDATRPESQKITVGMFDFNFYDRLKRQEFPPTKKGSSWASVTFKTMINTILEKNK